LTVTVNVQAVPTLFDESVGVQVTVVVPRLNVEPEAGEQVTVAPVQLSLAVGSVKVATTEHCPLAAGRLKFAGHATIVGACVSLTVTVNVQAVPVLFAASRGVQVTVVTPFAKLAPEAGTHVTVAPVQLSLAVGTVNVTFAAHCPEAVLVVMFAGQAAMVGSMLSGVTVTFNVPVAVKLPSLTCKVKLALVALHVATASAEIVPLVLSRLESVTPLDGLALMIVTIKLPGAVSLSPTVAMVEFDAGLPAAREIATGVIVGGVLVVKVAVAVLPVPPLVDETLPVMLTNGPCACGVMLTVTVQVPPTPTVAPLSLTPRSPGASAPPRLSVKVAPPQPVSVAPVGLATIRFGAFGNVSVKPTPVKATVLAARLLIVRVSVEV